MTMIPAMILSMAGVLVIAWLVLTPSLWLACRWSKVGGAGIVRTTGIGLAIVLLGAGLLSLGILAATYARFDSELIAIMSLCALLMLAMVLLAAFLIGAWWCVKRGLSTSARPAAHVTTLSLVPVSLLLGLFMGIAPFVWRAAIGEAFVVPSGAMAPTIYGPHSDVTCENCQYTFSVGRADRAQAVYYGESQPIPATCPNCGDLIELPIEARVLRGDRIIADKLATPNRWDAVVYRAPLDGDVSFVHRLVALPSETLEIIDGDLFINGRRAVKPANELDSLWYTVHDTAYVPSEAIEGDPRGWSPVSESPGWRGDGAAWSFSDDQDVKAELRFVSPLDDRLAYNDGPGVEYDDDYLEVGDVRVECHIDDMTGVGTIGLNWNYRGQVVTATVSAKGNVELAASSVEDVMPEIQSGVAHRDPSAAGVEDISGRVVTFAIRDGQASVALDGRIVAQTAVGWLDVATVRANRGRQPDQCDLRLTAQRCSVQLGQIVVSRDVYYRDANEMKGVSFSSNWSDDSRLPLQADEWAVLGDNSARSRDSRMDGPFTNDDLKGVVRWTYWPRARWRAFP